MTFRSFESPGTVDEAIAALSQPGAMALAGGQSLIPVLAQRGPREGRIVDLTRIDEMKVISTDGGQINVGAGVTLSAFLRSPLASVLPGFASAIAFVGNPIIRGRATLGGCIAWADPRGELPLCLIAYDAAVVTCRRSIPADDFFTGPWQTLLDDGELIIGMQVRKGVQAAFEELIARNSTGKAILSVLCVKHGEHIRATIGGLVDRPVRSGPLPLGRQAFEEGVGQFCEQKLATYPLLPDASSAKYRIKIAARLALRCLKRLESR
jgi:CO/xanthine dehydrogenase FAD-binding subunit